MCTNIKYIKNPTIRYREFIDNVFNAVNCNECEECRQEMQNEWFLRMYYQTLDTSDTGFSLQTVLTYNRQHRPYYEGYKVFRYTDIQKLLKYLHKYLERLGFEHKDLKYFVAAEYGTEEGHEHLPHYHFVVHLENVQNRITPFKLLQLIRHHWNKVKDNGFVFPRSFEWKRSILKISPTLNYFGKYACKDIGFYEDQENLKYKIENDEIFKLRITPMLPKHMQSQKYGIKLLECVDKKDLSTLEKVKVPLYDHSFKMPRYIRDKVIYWQMQKVSYHVGFTPFYNSNTESKDYKPVISNPTIRVLTQIGKEYKKAEFFKRIDRLTENFRNVVSVDSFNVYKSLRLAPFQGMKFESYNEFSSFVKKCLCGYNVRDFIIYRTLYRNLKCPNNLELLFDNGFISEFLDEKFNLPLIDTGPCPYVDKRSYYRELINFKFPEFETLCNFFDYVNKELGLHKQKVNFAKRKRLNKLKSHFKNPLLYAH